MSVAICFAKMLYKSRTEQKLTQLEAAELCHISLRHYQSLELGKTDPKLSNAVRIAEVMHFSLDNLKDEDCFDALSVQSP